MDDCNFPFRDRFPDPDPLCSLYKAKFLQQVRYAEYGAKGHGSH
jgi:hypothetical protein